MNTLRKHVLIIDDDEEDCDLFSDAMQMVDPNVECDKIFSTKNALALLNSKNYKPDFIFLDLNMPVNDGKKCLAEIGQIDAMKEVPVVIYTTSKRSIDIEQTKDLGAAYFISKPSSLSELCAEISFVLDKKWLQN